MVIHFAAAFIVLSNILSLSSVGSMALSGSTGVFIIISVFPGRDVNKGQLSESNVNYLGLGLVTRPRTCIHLAVKAKVMDNYRQGLVKNC